MRNLKTFRRLCGPDLMKNVVIASTFWGKNSEMNAGNAVNEELYAIERNYSSDLKQSQEEETAEALAEKDTELYKILG